MTILDEIVAYKKIQIEEEKQLISYRDYEKILEEKEIIIRDFTGSLHRQDGKISIISEIKKASPSKGIIKEDFNLEETIHQYEREDFSAYSVLTEKKYFKGDDRYIGIVKEKSNRPVLRKDFIVDKYQLLQAKVIGADGVLLIAEVLKDKLYDYYQFAIGLGLHPLVEIHSEQEIPYIEKANPVLIGINNRNLKTFHTDITHTEKVMKYLKKDQFIISESGIKGEKDMKYLKEIGVRGVLIGETLMRNLSNIKEVF